MPLGFQKGGVGLVVSQPLWSRLIFMKQTVVVIRGFKWGIAFAFCKDIDVYFWINCSIYLAFVFS